MMMNPSHAVFQVKAAEQQFWFLLFLTVFKVVSAFKYIDETEILAVQKRASG